MSLNRLTISEARDKLDAGEISSLDLVQDCLERIKEIDERLRSCLEVCQEKALLEAKEADARIKKGETGALLGIPYIAKDNILTKGVKTTAASKMLENYIAPTDATVIKKLRHSGAVLLAKSNLDEFAHGASTENSAFFTTRNPWDLERVPGGSSGGSAAAVAADLCLFALGTDTGGSVRAPASFCGVSGLKPSYGRCSRFGLIAMTSSTDVPGVLSKTVSDSALVLKAVAGRDEYDATTPDIEVGDYYNNLGEDLQGLTAGLPQEYFDDQTDPEVIKLVKTAVNVLEEKGVKIKETSLPYSKYSVPTYYIITPSEISSNMARFDGIRYGFRKEQGVSSLADVYHKSRAGGLGPEVKRRIMLGTYALSAGYRDAYYLQAQKTRTKIKEEMDSALEEFDFLITPTSPHIAFKIGEQSDDPLQMYLEDIFVSGASLAGLPALSIPCGFSQGLPVGMQVIVKRFDEQTLFDVSYNYQKATQWHLQKPDF